MEIDMSVQVFSGSKAYCTQKCRRMQSSGWKIESFRDIHGGKQVYKMVYVGMVRNAFGSWVSK